MDLDQSSFMSEEQEDTCTCSVCLPGRAEEGASDAAAAAATDQHQVRRSHPEHEGGTVSGSGLEACSLDNHYSAIIHYQLTPPTHSLSTSHNHPQTWLTQP